MADKKTGLGKGFEALIPKGFDGTLLANEQERIQKLLISDIAPNSGQPRTNFDEVLLEELADSIEKHGVLQPIIVNTTGDGYVIVAGERRWRAAQKAGLTHIPAIVRSMEDMQQLEVALVENVQRVDLSPLEQAVSIEVLRSQFNMSHKDIGQKLGKAETTVANINRLLSLPVFAQEALRDGLISEGHARAVLTLKNFPDKQQELVQLIIKNHWSVRQAEQFANATKQNGGTTREARERALKTTPQTEKLSKHLGKQVSIKRLAKGGKLEIAFASDDDLEALIALLQKLKA